MLCYRCGSHVQDGAEKCWNCGTILSASKRRGASTQELRARQKTGSRVFGVVFKIGDLIANRYRVKDIVGSGGAGVVYRAHDKEIDVDVAVKVINAKLVQTSDEQRLFSRQTKISRKLSHQNVVRIYDEGRDEQRPFFTMQFLEGLSLRKIIDLRKEKNQTFSLPEVEPIFNQLCQALDYAHATTFHGNLKPDNVIVLPDLLKITDFALLRGLPRKPFLAIQKSRGTNFRYLAPEVRLEVPDLNKSVDVYCLGVVLGEMLTGFVYDDAKPDAFSLERTGLEPSILAVIKRAVTRAPKDRYPTAGSLYDDLRSAMVRTRVPGEPIIQRNPVLAAAAGELPTQRLDLQKHGDRPKSDDDATEAVIPPREVSETLAVGDDMIVGSSTPEGLRAKAQQMADSAGPAVNPAIDLTPNKSNGVSKDAPLIDSVDEELRDAPAVDSGLHAGAAFAASSEDDTTAFDENEPTEAVLGLEEISNSAIELIADPRATNIIRVPTEEAEAEKINPTVQPVPLPDSAIPRPAFSQVGGGEATQQGRLDGGPDVVVAPALVTKGASGNGAARAETGARPAVHSPATRPPTATLNAPVDPAEAPKRKARSRPMTRPRISTIQPSAVPMVSTIPGGQSHLRPQTMPGMPVSQLSSAALVPPPPNNRSLIVTVALAAGAIVIALFALFIWQQRSHQQEMLRMQEQILQLGATAEKAADNEKLALADAEKAAAAQEDAQREEDSARLAAEEAQKKKDEAEKAAAEKAKEAEKLAMVAARASDDDSRRDAERRAAAAKKAAAEKRKSAEAEGTRAREEAKRADRERKRREAEARAEREAEQRAAREREARKTAEARADRLRREQEAKDEDASRKAEARRAAEDKKAEDTRRAEEKKKADAAKKAAKEAEKAKLAAAAAASAEPKCPKGMVLIKAGTFMMGAPRNDPERNFGDKAYSSIEVASYCVDYYEYPNGARLKPTARVSYKTAAARCRKRKKRLCTEEEWEKACKGRSGSRYPYGNQWDPVKCNTEDDEGNDREVASSGTFRKCRSGYNIYDMSGNVMEWTSSQAGSRKIVKGGAADRPGYDGRCAARKKKKATEVSEFLGFRCCATPK